MARPGLAAVAGLFAAVALAGCGGGTAGPLATGPSLRTAVAGRPHFMPTVAGASARVNPDTYLTYGGGPALVKPTLYLIFWGYHAAGDPEGVAKLLAQYASHVGGSGWANVFTQYYEISGKQKLFIKNPPKDFGGAWFDDSRIPKQPTDAQIAAEALKGVKHFGYDVNGAYVVATARGHSTSGFGSTWCAYHSSTLEGGRVVAYDNFPYTPDGGAVCGANFIEPPRDEKGIDEGVTIVAGHEVGEIVTDADPFSGWNSVQGEIGDICAWHDVQNDPFGTKSYASQPLFSDKTQSCVHSYP